MQKWLNQLIAIWVVDSDGSQEWKHKLSCICQVAPMCPHGRALHGRAHWCHVANTIELSDCSSSAALCQITLTNCYCYYSATECLSSLYAFHQSAQSALLAIHVPVTHWLIYGVNCYLY